MCLYIICDNTENKGFIDKRSSGDDIFVKTKETKPDEPKVEFFNLLYRCCFGNAALSEKKHVTDCYCSL